MPDAFKHTTEGFQFYRSPNRKLDPKLRELEEIRTGFARGSQFVFSQHCKACRDVGLSEEQIEAIPHWQIADCYAPVERALLAYTDCLLLQGGRVPQAIFDAMKKHLSDEEILEFTYITATYDMHATMSRALNWCHSVYTKDPNGNFVEFCLTTGAFSPAGREAALAALTAEKPDFPKPPANVQFHKPKAA